MHLKKHLRFSALKKAASGVFMEIKDHRQAAKVKYSIHDCLMSALAMMFFQDPSILTFQQRMQDRIERNNLTTIFGVDKIPKDSQMRDCLDPIDPSELDPVFLEYFRRLQRGKHLVDYQLFDGMYLVSMDGSQYFSSEKIHCPHCLVTKSRGKLRYHHQILQSVIVHPDMRQVIPLAPEQISNRDGAKKQDCEINAGKRVIEKIRRDHPKLGIIVTADGLYSKQPFIDKLKENSMSYILVAKPADHRVLFQWVEDIVRLGDAQTMELVDDKGRCTVDQMRRSSGSVCANLAETWRKRRYKAAFITKLSDAESEACETQVWIEFFHRCGCLDKD